MSSGKLTGICYKPDSKFVETAAIQIAAALLTSESCPETLHEVCRNSWLIARTLEKLQYPEVNTRRTGQS